MAAHHDHHHSHARHAPVDFGRAFAIGIALNLAFVAVEGGRAWTDSMSLLADAGHNLSDVLGLLIAWGGAELAKRPPSKRFTYGLRGSTILAALINALLLLVAVGAIALEAAQRLADPRAGAGRDGDDHRRVGIVVNGGTAMLFMRGRKPTSTSAAPISTWPPMQRSRRRWSWRARLILLTGAAWIDPADQPRDLSR
jgi:cobalt-zinc-cadmium efflux system protein